MKKFFQNIFLAGTSLLIGLALAEMLSRFWLPASLPNKLPVIRIQADPACGYRYVPGQNGYTLDQKVVINRWGFRGRDWEQEKPSGVTRIAILGDSYVYGQGVGEKQTFSAQLEDLLNRNAVPGATRYEVLNFGVSGYDTGHEIKVLERYAVKFQPDIVVLNFFLNDLLYIPDYSFYPEMIRKGEKNFSPWKWRLREFFRKSHMLMALWDLKGSFKGDPMTQLIQAYDGKNEIPPAGPGAEGWGFVIKQLEIFSDLAARNHFVPVLAVIPTPQEILKPGPPAAYAGFLKENSRRFHITPLVFAEDFLHDTVNPRSFFIPYDFHFTGEGNRRIAEILAKQIPEWSRQTVREHL